VLFDHEKLDVYRVSIEFARWSGTLIDEIQTRGPTSAIKQLERSSTSIPLNIAEGNGKRSARDRCRYLDIARGSALESSAVLDVLVARGLLRTEDAAPGKRLLLRVVEMLSKMTLALLGSLQSEHEHEHEHEHGRAKGAN
jgi:four helix bundle protein